MAGRFFDVIYHRLGTVFSDFYYVFSDPEHPRKDPFGAADAAPDRDSGSDHCDRGAQDHPEPSAEGG